MEFDEIGDRQFTLSLFLFFLGVKEYLLRNIVTNTPITKRQFMKKTEFCKSKRCHYTPRQGKTANVAKHNLQMLKNWNGKTLQHLPYVFDLSHSDFHLVRSSKGNWNDNRLTQSITTQLIFYENDINRLKGIRETVLLKTIENVHLTNKYFCQSYTWSPLLQTRTHTHNTRICLCVCNNGIYVFD